jgi:hypothetical protein
VISPAMVGINRCDGRDLGLNAFTRDGMSKIIIASP